MADFRVLVVCTANRFRSPLAEHFLIHYAQQQSFPVRVRSAGVNARDGEPLDSDVRRVLEARDVAVQQPWKSRRLSSRIIADSDLVLTATAAHRAAVVSLEPQALRRTYVLLQFARYAAGIELPADRWTGPDLIAAVGAARAQFQPVKAGADDTADPAGGSASDLRTCAETLQAAAAAILDPMNDR